MMGRHLLRLVAVSAIITLAAVADGSYLSVVVGR
jgi:hypothetical protein